MRLTAQTFRTSFATADTWQPVHIRTGPTGTGLSHCLGVRVRHPTSHYDMFVEAAQIDRKLQTTQRLVGSEARDGLKHRLVEDALALGALLALRRRLP